MPGSIQNKHQSGLVSGNTYHFPSSEGARVGRNSCPVREIYDMVYTHTAMKTDFHMGSRNVSRLIISSIQYTLNFQ